MYPLFLKLENKPCLVIGGGKIAERKALSLLEAGAIVTLISPDLTEELEKMASSREINYVNRLFETGDTEGFFLIIAATNSRESNIQIYGEASENNALINCVDDPRYCNFYVPAQVKRGSLKVAISTEGKLPMLAGRIRGFLNTLFPEDFGEELEELGQLRRDIIAEAGEDEDKKKEMFREYLEPRIDAIMKEPGR